MGAGGIGGSAAGAQAPVATAATINQGSRVMGQVDIRRVLPSYPQSYCGTLPQGSTPLPRIDHSVVQSVLGLTMGLERGL